MADITGPSVTIDYLVHQKIMHWINGTTNEVSGLGKLVSKANGIHVIDAILLPQRNTSGTTDIEPEDVAKAMFATKDTPGELRFWWHSHANMNVFWSSTDVDTMKMLAGPGWFLATVFNKKWESKTALLINKPFPLSMDNLTLNVMHEIPQELRDTWDAEYKHNVTNVTHIRSASYSGQGVPTYSPKDAEFLQMVEDNPTVSKKKLWKTYKATKKLGTPTISAPSGTTLGVNKFRPGKNGLPCIICGRQYTCDCPESIIASATNCQAAGFCFVCRFPFEQCDCEEKEYRDFAKKVGCSAPIPMDAPVDSVKAALVDALVERSAL